jgi:DNA-binding response OmpR family regulator
MVNVLVVARHDEAATSLRRTLRLRWPDVDLGILATRPQALAHLRDEPPDLLLITVGQPETIDLVREIRHDSDVPIIIIGADDLEAEIEALEAGADDCISSAADQSVFVARVSAVLRRCRRIVGGEAPLIKCGDLVVDPTRHEARLNGRPIFPTPTEFKLLCHLAQDPERVVSQQELEQLIWGCSDGLYKETLRTHMQRLRRKVESASGHVMIATVPRIGYRLTAT